MSDKKPTKEDIEAMWRDSNNWKWAHIVYACRDDPRVCVPKWVRWTGWTVNFAHPYVYPFLFFIIIIGVGPPLLYCLQGLKSPIVFLQIIGVSIAVLVGIGWYFSRIR